MDGFLIIDKQTGRSSAAELNTVKYALGRPKIGHAGTLDPFASGLLLALLGRTTRLFGLVQRMDKVYEGVILFGTSTDSDDITGKVLRESEKSPSNDQLQAVLPSFRGEIEQLPPTYSVKKVDGKRAYRLAREGQSFVLSPKRVKVHQFTIGGVVDRRAEFRVRCSSGTYIRALARDIGEILGCGASLQTLRRTAIGHLNLAKSVSTLAQIDADLVKPWYDLLSDYRELPISEEMARRLLNGEKRSLEELRTICDRQIRVNPEEHHVPLTSSRSGVVLVIESSLDFPRKRVGFFDQQLGFVSFLTMPLLELT